MTASPAAYWVSALPKEPPPLASYYSLDLLWEIHPRISVDRFLAAMYSAGVATGDMYSLLAALWELAPLKFAAVVTVAGVAGVVGVAVDVVVMTAVVGAASALIPLSPPVI